MTCSTLHAVTGLRGVTATVGRHRNCEMVCDNDQKRDQKTEKKGKNKETRNYKYRVASKKRINRAVCI